MMCTRLAPPPVRFSADDADRAYAQWGMNCGPAAVAAVAGLTPDEIRPRLGGFETKRYTNPTLMWEILNGLRMQWRVVRGLQDWPQFGLARVQWEGPWTLPSVPIRARYRHTHWVASCLCAAGVAIFDVNCMSVGGWVNLRSWSDLVVPWILEECVPRASGGWHLTHVVEVVEGSASI